MNDAHIDHFLPWSIYPVNRFLNLVPAVPDINSKKSDKLPVWTDAIEQSMKSHIANCLEHKDNPIIAADLEYYFRIVQKNQNFQISNISQSDLDSLTSYVETELQRLKEIVPGKRFYC